MTFKTAGANFPSAKAYIGQPVLVMFNPGDGNGARIFPGTISSVDDFYGAGVINVDDPAIDDGQLENFEFTKVGAALAGDPTQMTNATWMPVSLADLS